MQDLIPQIEEKNIPSLFVQGGLNTLLAYISDIARSIIVDITTAKGRTEIAHVAASVARSKTYLDNIGKAYVSTLKEMPKEVDEERKRMREILDNLKIEVRKPLTDWEDSERNRVEGIKRKIMYIRNIPFPASIIEVEDSISKLKEFLIDSSFEEYEQEAREIWSSMAYQMQQHKEKLLLQEEEDLNRKEEEEKIKKDRIEQQIRKALESSRKEAEEHERKMLEEQREKYRIEIEEIRKSGKEKQRKAIEEERDRFLIERQKELLERKREREKEEQERIKRLEELKKENDIEHRRKINNEVLNQLVELNVPDAKLIVTLVASGRINHMKMVY